MSLVFKAGVWANNGDGVPGIPPTIVAEVPAPGPLPLASGVGDTIRVFNNGGTQVLPNSSFSKITLFDTEALPPDWPVWAYGILGGGISFQWDGANKRVNVLRSCIVQPSLNMDSYAIDAPIVDPITGLVDAAQPFCNVVFRTGNAQNITDALSLPLTKVMATGFYGGMGNTTLTPFPVSAGDWIELHIGAFNSSGATVDYVDMTLRNISPTD